MLLLTLACAIPGTVAASDEEVAALNAARDVLPFVAYGLDGLPDSSVRVTLGGSECGTTDVNARGEWVIWIAVDAPCKPRPGDILTFTIEGIDRAPTEVWYTAGLPANLRTGITFRTRS